MHLPWSAYRKPRFQCRRCLIEAAFVEKLKHAASVVVDLGNRVYNDDDNTAQKMLAQLVPEVEKAIQGASEEEKSCIRTSFIYAYMTL